MLKINEETDKNSCFNRALPNERMFILLARDPAAPKAIMAWIAERIRSGKNVSTDPEIQEALQCVRGMESDCISIRLAILEAKELTCDICGTIFKTLGNLRVHEEGAHE